MNNLEITSLILLIIGVSILFGSLLGFGFVIIIVKPIEKLSKRFFKIDKRINENTENFLLGFLLFIVLYVFIFPILFILMIRDWLLKKDTPEMSGKEGVYLSVVHFPLLLIWFSGWLYIIKILIF